MHEFPSLEATETSLQALIERSPQPLAARLPRQAGMKEQRYAHLLSGEVKVAVPEVPSGPDSVVPAIRPENERLAKLEQETAALRAEVSELRQQVAALGKQLE